MLRFSSIYFCGISYYAGNLRKSGTFENYFLDIFFEKENRQIYFWHMPGPYKSAGMTLI